MHEIELLKRAAARGDKSAAGNLSVALLERGLLGGEHAETLANGLPKIGSGVRRGGGWTRDLNRSCVRVPLPPGLQGRVPLPPGFQGDERDVRIWGAWKGVREKSRCRNVYLGHMAVWSDPGRDMLSSRIRKAPDMRQRTVLAPGWSLGDVAEAIEASYRWAVELRRLRMRVVALVSAGDDDTLDELAGPPGHRRNLFMSSVTLIKLDLGLLTTD